MNTALQNQLIQSIAVFRPHQISGMLCSIPAFRTLRRSYPGARITLIGLPWAKDFVARFPMYIDDFIEFPGYPGLTEAFDSQQIVSFLQTIQNYKFDLLLQMYGNGTIENPLMNFFHTKHIAGFVEGSNYIPPNQLFFQYPLHVHEIDRQLSLLRLMGLVTYGSDLEFPISKQEKESAEELMKEHLLRPKSYVVIHPGARDPRQRWDTEKFAAVADSIAERGYDVVLTGSVEESPITAVVQYQMERRSTDLAGKTDLGVTGYLIEQATMVISNDTGISQIAAATRTPSMVVFSPYSDATRWAPLDTKLHKIITPMQTQDTSFVIRRLKSLLPEKIEEFSESLPKITTDEFYFRQQILKQGEEDK